MFSPCRCLLVPARTTLAVLPCPAAAGEPLAVCGHHGVSGCRWHEVRFQRGYVQAISLENTTWTNMVREQMAHHTTASTRSKPMLHQFGKTLGGAMAVLCLVSTLAMADEMTCTAGDGKGNCTAATGPDGK